MRKHLALALLPTLLISCGGGSDSNSSSNSSTNQPTPQAPVGKIVEDGSVVKGRATYVVTNDYEYAYMKFLKGMVMDRAYAAAGSTDTSYDNASKVKFAIDTTAFAPGAMTGDFLSLGSVALDSLDDNDLKVCGAEGDQKCTKAIIRVYTTGSTQGFVHSDGYGAPVYAGSLNPNTEVGLDAAGSVQVQVIDIPTKKNKLKLSDFPSPSYDVKSDFANAGAGSYSMTFVVEYALSL